MESLLDKNGSPTADPQRISEILYVQYKSALAILLGHMQIAMPDEFNGSTDLHNKMTIIYSTNIEEADVISVIDEMSSNSATGPNGFQQSFERYAKGL